MQVSSLDALIHQTNSPMIFIPAFMYLFLFHIDSRNFVNSSTRNSILFLKKDEDDPSDPAASCHL